MELFDRIVPVPKQAQFVEGAALTLTDISKFTFSAPEAAEGPAKTAAEQLLAYLTGHCGPDCLAEDGIAVKLELGQAPAEVTLPEEGYRLQVSAEGISVTGFGASGLYYGVVTLQQLLCWENGSATLPALEVLDWPDSKYRGLLIESRYGSNMMEREDWLAMLDDLASKKMNAAQICLYGCWSVQFGGKVSEYLYIPLRNHPELSTPMAVKYYSPTEGRWIDYEKLPPIFRDDLFGELVAYGKARGITVIPFWNSMGHNTYLPAQLPETSAKEEDGEPTLHGFCTSNDATYELLFSIYDQIIDEYLLPNGIDTFHIGMDEIQEGCRARNANDISKIRSPWCKCEKCRTQEKEDRFIDHIIKLMQYLKSRGMKTIQVYCDMLAGTSLITMGWLMDKFLVKVDEAGLRDVLQIDWWTYLHFKDLLDFDNIHPELNIRSIAKPWNGYYIWIALSNVMDNVSFLAEMNHRDGGEGIIAYATWDRSYDRTHDCIADFAWGYEQTGTLAQVTKRHIYRHFGSRFEEAQRAYRMLDWVLEYRRHKVKDTQQVVISTPGVVLTQISYYYHGYFNPNKQYPRNFLGETLAELILPYRHDMERTFYTSSATIKEAMNIFLELSKDPKCDMAMASRMAYECHNIHCLLEDWIAILQMYDLCNEGKLRQAAKLALTRRQGRLELMAHCEQAKEAFFCQALAMRTHSIFMQMFTDLAAYMQTAEEAPLDLTDAYHIMSPKFRSLQ